MALLNITDIVISPFLGEFWAVVGSVLQDGGGEKA